MDKHKPYDIQQGQRLSPAPRKEELLAVIQAGDGLPEEQLCWKRFVALHKQLNVNQHQALAAKVANSILG